MEIEQRAIAEPNLVCALGEERSVLETIVILQNYYFAVTLVNEECCVPWY